MRDQEIVGLWEAYNQVYAQPQEEVEQLDEAMSSYDRNRQRAAQRAAARNEARKQGKTGNVPGVGYVSPRPERETYRDSAGTERHKTGARMPKKEDQKESFDLFDAILEHLVAEGYADTNENALVIMANMSEEWRESIVEGREGGRFEYNQRHGRPLITPEVSQSKSSQETLGGGTYQRGPKRLPKSKRKYDRQVLSGVRAASEQEKQRARERMGIKEDIYDIILSHLLDEGEKPFPYEKVTAQQKKHSAAGNYGNTMKMGLAKRRAKESDKKGGSQQDAGKGWYHGK